MNNRIILLFVTLYFFISCSSSQADTIFVYGLNSRSAGQTEIDLKKSLRTIIENAGHKILIDGPATKNELLTTGGENVDWIIFIGHGIGSKGYIIDDNDNYFHPLGDLISAHGWENIKGVLIFGCSVIDIGDFGWQNIIGGDSSCSTGIYEERGKNGNWCNVSCNFDKLFPRPTNPFCSEDEPDPGLLWEELARRKNIKYLLGFNYEAPKLNKGGKELIEKFFATWMDKGVNREENFYRAWKDDLTIPEQPDLDINIIERGYIRCDNGNDKTCWYSMGRSNNLSTSLWKDDDIFWPSIWNERWGANWEAEGKYRPTWPGGENDEMSIDQYWKKKFPSCEYKDVSRKEQLILYNHLRHLCAKGIISGDRDEFYPTVDASFAAVSKMMVNASGIERKPINKDFDCKTEDNGEFKFGCDYIDDLVASEIIEGRLFIDFDPSKTVDRAYFMKILMNTFFKEPPEKGYDCPSVITDKNILGNEKEKQWYCQYFLAADNCGLLNDDLLKIDGKISPKIAIKRGEAAILVDRARILKETGKKKCLPSK